MKRYFEFYTINQGIIYSVITIIHRVEIIFLFVKCFWSIFREMLTKKIVGYFKHFHLNNFTPNMKLLNSSIGQGK